MESRETEILKRLTWGVLLVLTMGHTQSYDKKKLWKSAKTGAVDGINYFKGLDANIKNEEGQTPLMIAVKNGYTDVVRSLDVAIVNVQEEDYAGKTAYDYIQIPTSREEDMYSRRMYGALRTLEVYQIIRGKAKIVQYSYKNDTDILKITIKGAKCDDFLFPEKTECTSLKTPSKHAIFQAIKSKDNAEFDRLLPTVDDLSIRNKSKYTPLWASIHYKNYYALEQLLDAGADMYELDQFDLKTPVYWATMTNNTKLLKILLKHGADVNSKDVFGSLALSTWAFKCNNFEAIKILLDNGANPNLKDKRGKTVFDEEPSFCKNKENIEKMKQLLKERSAFSE